jgi:hypothetical protein
VLAVIEEADGAGTLRDAGGLVVGGEDDAPAEARRLVAVRVIGETGRDRAAILVVTRPLPEVCCRMWASASIALRVQYAAPLVASSIWLA